MRNRVTPFPSWIMQEFKVDGKHYRHVGVDASEGISDNLAKATFYCKEDGKYYTARIRQWLNSFAKHGLI